MYAELARQRHQEILAEAKRNQLVRQARRDGDGGTWLRGVGSALAAVIAAVTTLSSRPRPAPTQSGLSPTG
jgi:hypothetical protein